MNITPVTKKYTNPYNTCSLSFGKKSGASENAENINFCTKLSVKNTSNEFSNSRGNCLADIDLSDIYIPNAVKAPVKNYTANIKPTKTNMTNIQFLADMALCDAYEVPAKQPAKQAVNNNNLELPFEGAYPQFLVDQDAAEQYETTSEGINDIANSSYCSFGKKEETLLDMFKGFVRKMSAYL